MNDEQKQMAARHLYLDVNDIEKILYAGFEIRIEAEMGTFSGEMYQQQPEPSIEIGRNGICYDPITGGTKQEFFAVDRRSLVNLINLYKGGRNG